MTSASVDTRLSTPATRVACGFSLQRHLSATFYLVPSVLWSSGPKRAILLALAGARRFPRSPLTCSPGPSAPLVAGVAEAKARGEDNGNLALHGAPGYGGVVQASVCACPLTVQSSPTTVTRTRRASSANPLPQPHDFPSRQIMDLRDGYHALSCLHI